MHSMLANSLDLMLMLSVIVDPEPILGAVGMRQEQYTQDGILACHWAPFIYTFAP